MIPKYAGSQSSTNSDVCLSPEYTKISDILIAIVSVDSLSSPISGPSGWTTLANEYVLSTSQAVWVGYIKVETIVSSYTWTTNSSSNRAIKIQRFTNVESVGGYNFQLNGNVTTNTAPTITTDRDNCIVIWAGGGFHTATMTSFPTGFIPDGFKNYDISSASSRPDHLICSRLYPTLTTTGNISSLNWSTSTGIDQLAGMIWLKPKLELYSISRKWPDEIRETSLGSYYSPDKSIFNLSQTIGLKDLFAYHKNAGYLFENNNVAGIISTYSLVSTGYDYYGSGVLANDGSIHFIPRNAPVGQKVFNDVASTYSLIYTTTKAYTGGVLAPNGDIHFVPANAVVGQKISADGIVSTYSLVYTNGNQAYLGGTLDIDGNVHFAPAYAPVGQKVAVDGTVSTYSLVWTLSELKHWGAVLSDIGEIHFVPYSSRYGQKVATDGSVSTYSLIQTGASKHIGGVLAMNGDIHFVPYNITVGQKISADGVVSTYSLANTLSTQYYGGCLAPNGDIHFMVYSATPRNNQRVKPNGEVVEYSLLYTSGNPSNSGAVVDKDGCIHMIPFASDRGQKINVLSGRPFDIGLACSPFINNR